MAEKRKIGLKEVRELPEDTLMQDAALPGFCARRQRSEVVTFLVRYRAPAGGERWYKIGRFGHLTPDQARDEAKRVLARVALGEDPARDRRDQRQAPTVTELCDAYMAEAEAGRLLTRRRAAKRPGTILSDRGRLDRHVKPLLGSMKVAAVTTNDVRRFMHDVAAGKTAGRAPTGRARGLSNVRGGQGAASRTVGLLGGVFAWAIERGWRDDNPVRGVVRPRDNKRERRLTDEEYLALGQALTGAANAWPPAAAALRFLALTGWRAGEALELTWRSVDLAQRTATLPMTKTGKSVRALASPAAAIITTMRDMPAGDLVFPSQRGGLMSGFRSSFDRILKTGGLPADITPHVLRHSFASVAADIGYSELAIAALLGHATHSTTAKYIHRADAVVLAAADRVAAEIATRMGEAPETGSVVQFRAGAST